MKKLLIDVDSILPLYTKGYLYGVGRSTYELVKALNEIEDIPFDITLFSHNMKGLGCRNLDTRFKKLHFYLPNRAQYNHVCDALKLRKLFSRYDLMHIPHNAVMSESLQKSIFTIHDLIVYRYPEMWNFPDSKRKENQIIADNCKSIVTCSNSSKNDIIRFWNVPDEKVKVIYWGINRDIFFPDYDQKKPNELSELNGDFFFSASCNHPRKRPEVIVQAFDEYISKNGNHSLVMLKPYGLDLGKYSHLTKTNKLIILDHVSDNALRWLYTNAKATIVASLYEGFGFPVLESLACHTQVICAENSSLVEAGGSIVDYFQTDDTDKLSSKLLDYSNMQKQDSINPLEVEGHLKSFTWDKCAREYVNFWNNLFNE